ncbi:MAG: YdcF family protein [Polyangiaceae bacterium]|nr:YdcF family protein [Polyangiaceae bacterium]
MKAFCAAALLILPLIGCFRHRETPVEPPKGALAGLSPSGFNRQIACGKWEEAAASDPEALRHVSFPELSASACYVPVRYKGEVAQPDPIPKGCEYPSENARTTLIRERDRYSAIAGGRPVSSLPPELACVLSTDVLTAAARQNAAALSAVLQDLDAGRVYPYSAVAVFGFGHRDHGSSVLTGVGPQADCVPMVKSDFDLLSINVTRAGRGAMAHAASVAPVVIMSGGAVHSPLIEAFALAHVARCRFGVPRDRILVDPCADHTHTNVKHMGSLVIALGGKTAYAVTDSGIQADYLNEDTIFRLIGGDIDQRALRDWGYLLGSWRRASVGMSAGFWLTPYRFWAEPTDGLGSFSCVR